MAVVNTLATPVSNADASPVVPNYPKLVNGDLRCSAGSVTKAGSDSNASTYRLARLPSHARIVGLGIKSAAITGMTDVDIGVYQTAANGGAVVEKDALEDGLDMSSAINTIAGPGGVAAADGLKPLWELLGLSEDPGIDYDIVATANAAGAGSGVIGLNVLWVV